MSKLAVFRRQATIGSYVTLRLTRGDDISGLVLGLDETHISLELEDKTATIFEDILAGWELHPCKPTNDTNDLSERHLNMVMDRQDKFSTHSTFGSQEIHSQATESFQLHNHTSSESNQSDHGNSQNPISSSVETKISSLVTRIDAAFAEAAKRARLVPPEPDFTFPESSFPKREVAVVRREWDRARNQYEYALKVNELSRISNLIAQVLVRLVEQYPAIAALRALLGQLLLKLSRTSEAKVHFMEAASLSDDSGHWLALAYVAGEETALKCYALQRYFRFTPPNQDQDAWFLYISLVIEHRDWRALTETIQRWTTLDNSDQELARFLQESLIFLTSKEDEPFANQAAEGIASQQKTLPLGWESFLARLDNPSGAVLSIQRRFTEKPTISSPTIQICNLRNQVEAHKGRIISFGTQLFGFIQDSMREKFFFTINDVVDDRLHRSLLEESWRSMVAVEFATQSSPGHDYDRATNITPLYDAGSALQIARLHLRDNEHSKALALVRKVISEEPDADAAKELEMEIKQSMRKLGIGLPSGEGPYAKAKRAQMINQDFKSAEVLYRRAIEEDDKSESAIKDLASLLQQTGKAYEAIALLEQYASKTGGVSPYLNMLATFYQHAERHDDAIGALSLLVSVAQTQQQRGSLLRRISFSHFKAGRYDEAERILRELLKINPHDITAVKWLAGLEEAREGGNYEEASIIIGDLGLLAAEGIQLSSLARSAIHGCSFAGVDPQRVQKGAVDSKDIERVEALAKELGTKKPRDRASYYLSAAALLERNPSDEGPERLYDYLRRYFASMAAASWIEKKPADVVRSYYVESLALVFGNNLNEAWHSLLSYLATFAPSRAGSVQALLPRGRNKSPDGYGKALIEALQVIAPEVNATWNEGILILGSQSQFARERIGEAIIDNQAIARVIAKALSFDLIKSSEVRDSWNSKCREYDRKQRQRLSVCRTLTKYQATVASMEDLNKQLQDASTGMSSEVDHRRLNALRNIVEDAIVFCEASDFEGKEERYWMVTTQADRFKEETVDAPTQYSHEGLLPISEHLKALIENEYAQMVRTSGAELDLRLLVEQYMRDEKGELRLQIEILNKQGCSPASSVRLCLAPNDSMYFGADVWEREVTSTLRGGDAEVTQMVLSPKEPAIDDRAFPINVMATYSNRLGEEIQTPIYSWTVRLYNDQEFQHLDNPYAPFAEGGPVDDAEMFVGRDELLSRLEYALFSGFGSKSIVIFGQKRAGKSSLLEHLKRRLYLRENVIPIGFSLQDVAPDLTVPALLHRILQETADVLEELRFSGQDVPEFLAPDVNELESYSTIRFHERMSLLMKLMKRSMPSFRLVLLVDEFTDIFKQIRNDRIPSEFMKAWKAIIEKKYFSSVLVGQDIMPTFQAEFPNEFGVTEDVRVSYLDEVAAANLVQKPIGEKRFAGTAVRRLLELTAGSPYYTMMFCARLVDYMNSTRSVIVTEADILSVEENMLRGDRRLTQKNFDNLLSAGDGAIDSGIDPDDTFAVCSAIAHKSNRGWCSREVVPGFEASALDGLLEDLEKRDVVERKGTAYRLRVGLFRDWLKSQG
jgi:tetratricopeptide (TPR) repeat protein